MNIAQRIRLPGSVHAQLVDVVDLAGTAGAFAALLEPGRFTMVHRVQGGINKWRFSLMVVITHKYIEDIWRFQNKISCEGFLNWYLQIIHL